MTLQADTQPNVSLTEDEKQLAVLAAIVNTSHDIIVSKTLQGIITSWNAAAERMFGYKSEEAIGQHISLIIPTSRLSEENYIIERIKAGEKIDHFETVRIAKDGREIPVSLSVSPILDSKGNIIGASKIGRDISAQLEAKEVALRLYEQVNELNQKKDEFIGLASHELKTPLTSISGYLQILSRVNTEEKNQKYIDKAQQQVKRLTALVNGLLDVSRIEAGRLQLDREEFNLNDVINDRIELALLTGCRHKILLESPLENYKVNADKQRIEQVLDSLLSNAIKYSPGANSITIFINCNEQKVVVAVRDSGIGIKAHDIDHIFTRFYRIDDAAPNISGLGVGLYLSQEIITRHDEELWVESEPGKGSVFYFTLPLL